MYTVDRLVNINIPIHKNLDKLDVPKSYAFTIVTAASANHLCSLENFLYSLQHFRSQLTAEEYPRVVVYNIGMNRTQLPVLDQLKDNGLLDELIHFDYTQYPEFWDVSLNAGEYAWKTGIVHEASQRYDGLLLWLDAGNLVTLDFLKNIPSIIRDSGGFWSPRSAYTMRRYTHPGLFRHYGIQPSEYGKKANCNGAAIGFDVDNKTVVDSLILPWYKCGLEKRCIAPPGSSRKNHRQDQAALTLLVYRSGHSCKYPSRMFHQLQIHRDVSCRANLIELDIQNQLFHPSSIDSPQWTENSTIELSYHPEWRFPEGRLTTQELQ
ncbi:uncharacterized protein BYT42DRAFT_593796 [Radiomyces spectabilis]|uniref:uncharacterized protein n=1 Tax=Radiomyces spectabilis TaxID=64574 RepID=UPI00221E5C3B|nr:uncharacterized protein BYT42DRAFT_593796 [Radiomyces spectabilis]KAI8377553.1 hypothetical protein BYT42DRAFT_593796 [Radiomyces spectabilis]